jgi:D-3-phosphoglycerate dehydrogenase
MKNAHLWKILNLADIGAFPLVLDELKDIAQIVTLPASQETLRENIGDYEVYFASLHVRLDRAAIECAKKLRVVATPTTGLDHLDVKALEERGIALISIKNDIEFLSRVTATAEMTWALLLAVARRLPWSFASAQKGVWARDGFRGHQLSGKTLGILGYGRLGRIVAEYGHAFRMRVLACDRKPREALDAAPFVELVDFETLLRQSDALSIHIHLTPETEKLIGAREFSLMKRGAILLNTSRGAIIDEAALLESLQSGHLGGAGLDIIVGEWREDLEAHPLIQYANAHQNLVISPHTGGITVESQSMALEFLAAKLKAYLQNLDVAQ